MTVSENKGIVCPEGSLVVTQVDNREWEFEYPRLEWEIYESFHGAIEYWQMGNAVTAEETYRQLIDDYPEFIDAHHHLALLLGETGRGEEAFQIWQEVVALGLACLPQEFEMGRDTLPWLMVENRPFLRAYHGLGLEYLDRGEIEAALAIFNNMLAMNPDDNQGIRALVVDCNFRLNRPGEVLAVCGRYPDDAMEQLVYGCPLALYQLGRRAEAEEALSQAVEFLPLVAVELVRDRHTRPKDLHPGTVTHGGADQAYYYWTDQGGHWENTPGAIELVRNRLRERYFNADLVGQAQEQPLRRDMVTLLTFVRDNKVVGTQSTGNMPLKAVRQVTARFVNPPQLDTSIGDRTFRLRSEEDVWPLHFLRILAEVGGLLAIAPARRWRLTPKGKRFLNLDPMVQLTTLLAVWWYRVNWLIVYPFRGMGEALPRYFEQDTLAHLRALPVRTRIPFEEFADRLIGRTRLTWTSPDSDYATTSLRGSIEQMVIRILADFGAVKREHRAEPLGTGTIRKLAAFEITPFGTALLDAVALASE
jgi:tetratricopeptide (TPR) repeat protein